MRVLIACESSGTVRDAFIRGGHDAMSCDLLPSDAPGPHYQGDVRDVIHGCWDLMIAHPPCTHLSVSGAHRFAEKRMDGRQQSAISFFMELAKSNIPMIAVENPVGIMSSLYRKPDQIIQPWQFGHDASKATCLWLKGLPALIPTKLVNPSYACACGNRFDYALGKNGCASCAGDSGAAKAVYSNQTASGQNRLPPSKNRWKERSKTFQGIAEAMAAQWGASAQMEIAV